MVEDNTAQKNEQKVGVVNRLIEHFKEMPTGQRMEAIVRTGLAVYDANSGGRMAVSPAISREIVATLMDKANLAPEAKEDLNQGFDDFYNRRLTADQLKARIMDKYGTKMAIPGSGDLGQ